jgi:hypothetical protein
MAELADMLKGLLDDPSTVEKLKGALGGNLTAPSRESAPPDIDPAMLMRITGIMKKMNGSQADARSRLLLDLKPYISPARAKRVDEAVGILKLLWVAELVKGEEDSNDEN